MENKGKIVQVSGPVIDVEFFHPLKMHCMLSTVEKNV